MRTGASSSVLTALLIASAIGCGAPETSVIVENRYPPVAAPPLSIYRAFWQAVAFTEPIPPGFASVPQSTVPASANTAYVVLAPEPVTPATLIVLQSLAGFAVSLGSTLHIPVDDTTFAGHCAADSHLTQAAADFITTRVFPDVFAGLAYDAATCATTGLP